MLPLDHIAADFNFPVSRLNDIFIDSDSGHITPVHSKAPKTAVGQSGVPAPEPSATVILLSGLGFFAISAALRTLPDILRRLRRERKQGRRRKVKVEMRMMA